MNREAEPQNGVASAEVAAHCALQLGRILLQNGGDTGQVQRAVTRFASACGYEAHLLVTYEALLLTLVGHDTFRTKIGNRIPAMNVGMSALVTAYEVVDRVRERGRRPGGGAGGARPAGASAPGL